MLIKSQFLSKGENMSTLIVYYKTVIISAVPSTQQICCPTDIDKFRIFLFITSNHTSLSHTTLVKSISIKMDIKQENAILYECCFYHFYLARGGRQPSF